MRKLFTTLLLGSLCTFAYAQKQMPSVGLAASSSVSNTSRTNEKPLSAQNPTRILAKSPSSVQMQIFCPELIASFRASGFSDAQIIQKLDGASGIDNIVLLNNDVIQAKLDSKNANFILNQYFNIKN